MNEEKRWIQIPVHFRALFEEAEIPNKFDGMHFMAPKWAWSGLRLFYLSWYNNRSAHEVLLPVEDVFIAWAKEHLNDNTISAETFLKAHLAAAILVQEKAAEG